MRNNYLNYHILYWDHVSNSAGYINDCFGNSKQFECRARNNDEAVRKLKKKCGQNVRYRINLKTS
jgi:hypothetical protein